MAGILFIHHKGKTPLYPKYKLGLILNIKLRYGSHAHDMHIFNIVKIQARKIVAARLFGFNPPKHAFPGSHQIRDHFSAVVLSHYSPDNGHGYSNIYPSPVKRITHSEITQHWREFIRRPLGSTIEFNRLIECYNC